MKLFKRNPLYLLFCIVSMRSLAGATRDFTYGSIRFRDAGNSNGFRHTLTSNEPDSNPKVGTNSVLLYKSFGAKDPLERFLSIRGSYIQLIIL